MNISRQGPFLFFGTGYFMYIGMGADTQVHEHHAIQIAVSFDLPIEIILPGTSVNLQAVIIDSDQPHECRTFNSSFLLLNIDPESNIGMSLRKQYLVSKKVAGVPENIAVNFIESLKALEYNSAARDQIHALALNFLYAISNIKQVDEVDVRILKILDVLREPGDAPVKIEKLASTVFLSPSRLVHLFTEQVGIPIRKYVLWSRLLVSLQAIIENSSLTTAAMEGGFSDAPHFNRTFKRMFGLNPSMLIKNSQIIQVYPR